MIKVYVNNENYIVNETCHCDFCKKEIPEENIFYTIYTETEGDKRTDKIICSECAKTLSNTLKIGIDKIGIDKLEVLTITQEEWDGTYLRLADKKPVEFDENELDLNCEKVNI